jgi:mediator of RNA polymerase II transcription subunit 7
MADGGTRRAIAAAYPPPPPFWRHFTSENLQKLEQIKANHLENQGHSTKKTKKWTPAELQALAVPTELRYLIPPEIPKTGSYTVFGEPQSVSATTLPQRHWFLVWELILATSSFPCSFPR